jgi:hypothetical protein
MLPNPDSKFFATLGGKQLRITESANAVPGIKNYRRCYYRTKERTPANLVSSGNKFCARAPGTFLKLERAPQPFQKAQLRRSRG